jgi:hypothetical protein
VLTFSCPVQEIFFVETRVRGGDLHVRLGMGPEDVPLWI